MNLRKISEFWNLPHPFIYKTSSFVLPGVITVVLIFLLSPFNIFADSTPYRFIFSLVSGTIVSVSIIAVVHALRRFAPVWSRDETWTIGKEVILFTVVISVIALFHLILFKGLRSDVSWTVMFRIVVIRTLGIAFLPVFALVLFEQYNYRTQQLKRALELTKKIRRENISRFAKDIEEVDESIWFHNENGKPACQVIPNEIQFIKSDGNYIEVFTLNPEHKQKKFLIRNKLAHAESILPADSFVRTHRSYIANLQQVEMVQGNARNLELVMKLSDQIIPVSRAKAHFLMEKI